MIRETLVPGSKYAMMMVTPTSGTGFQYRSSTSGSSVNVMTTGLTAPRWVKLERRGNVLTGYQSADGVTWVLSQRLALPMAANVYAGLAVCSHSANALATVVFDQVLLDATTASMALPWPWTENTIGTSTDQGVALYDSNYVLSNLGADIWSPADKLKFVSQPLVGDGTLTVKVSSMASSDGWSRFGLMMRESLDANAKNVLLSLTTGNGLVFQSRQSVNASTAFRSSAISKSAPVWLKLDRSGNIFTASYSADGVTWTVQGTETIAMNASIVVGLGYANRSTTVWAFGAGDQLKLVTPLDTDGNGLPDAWETQYFGHLGVSLSADLDGDGLTNAQEWELGTNPTVATVSGQRPVLTSVSGDNQVGTTGSVLPQPLTVKVTDAGTGAPLAGVMITFRVLGGGALLGSGSTWQAVPLTALSDVNGLAQTGVQLSATGGLNTVQVVVGNQASVVTFALKSLLGSPGASFLLDNGDIGAVTSPGQGQYAAGTYTLTATSGDIWGTVDSFRYAWQSLAGDGLFVARVAGMSTTGAKAGLMIRESLDANSRAVSVLLTPSISLAGFEYRDTTAGGTGRVGKTGIGSTGWLALRRSGSVIAGYYSADGIAWSLLGSRTFVTAQPVYVGLAYASLSGTSGNATFDTVSVSPLAPSPWTVADIGSYNAGNLDQFANDTVFLNAGGNDIWGTSDNFRYAFQPLAADGRMVVRVAAQANTNSWAKSGLMVRDSTAANARYAFLMLTPGKGVSLQSRAQTGASAYLVTTLAGPVAPTWLKLERLGASVDAYESADGQSWTKVGSVNWGFGPALIGLAAASLNTSANSGSVFDNLSVNLFGGQAGWSAAYYSTGDLSGQPSVRRRDATVDFNWAAGQAPVSSVATTNYSVRWQGFVSPPASDTYTFTVLSSGGTRLWVDGQLLIDRWALQASATEVSSQVALQAGTQPQVVLEYFNGAGAARIQLRWSGTGQADAVISTGSVQPVDTDNDGLPDAWETAHGLNPLNASDAALSPDGDGLTALQKYQLGLNLGQRYDKTPGVVVVEQWQNLGGGSVGNLTDSPLFPNQPTTRWLLGSALDVGPNIGDNYGLRIRGYIVAPVDGAYRFWVAGDDEAQLWLSPTDSPFDRINIAHTGTYTAYQDFDRLPGQTSKMITLQAGHAYYFEVLMKEAGGGDHVSVAWQIPGQARALLSTQYLESFAPRADNPGGDGLPDAWKLARGLDPAKPYGINGASGDFDGDGLSNLAEYQLGTDPTKADTDGDGVSDQIEALAGSDPLAAASLPPASTAPWMIGDVGTVTGSAQAVGTVAGGYLVASPATGVKKGAVADDNFHALYQPVSTDFELSAYVDEASEAWWASAALVVRSSLAPQGAAATLAVDHLGEGWFYARSVDQAATTLIKHVPLSDVAPTVHGHWLKLRRQGNVITSSYSADGQTWIRIDTAEISLSGPCMVGLAAWGGGIWNFSHVSLRLDSAGTGRFDDQGPVTYQDILTGSDPVPPGVTVRPVAAYAGNTGVASAGSWKVVGDALVSQMPKSAVDFTITLPADGVYRLEIEAQSPGNPSLNVDFPLEISIDGQFLGRADLFMDPGQVSLAHVATPFLSAGAHTVHLFYDSTLSYRPIRLNALRVQALDGPDSDGNGRPDWVDDRLALINTLRGQPAQSYTSPVNLEGSGRFLSLMSVTAEGVSLPVSPAPGFGWYADVPLSPVGAVSVDVTFENAALTRSTQIAWQAINLLADNGAAFPTGVISIRKGDRLRFSAIPSGAAAGSASIAITGGGTPVTLTQADTQADPVIQLFDTAGTYTVTGTFSDGTTGTLTVQVVSAQFNGAPTAGLGSVIAWDNPLLPTGTPLDVDQGLILTVQNPLPGGGERLSLLTQNLADSYAVARLSPNGPILAGTVVHSLRVASDEQTAMDVLTSYADGSLLIGTPIILSSVPPDVRVVVDIVVSGVTFADGTLTQTFTAADFDSQGRLYVKFLYPAGLGHSFCHRISVYNGATFLGSF